MSVRQLLFKVHPGETSLIAAFRASSRFLNAKHSLLHEEALPTGDISIHSLSGTHLYNIERKAKNDAVQSLDDKRYSEQRARMDMLKSAGVRVGFIFEKANLSKELLHLVTSLTFKHKFFCMYSANPEQTVHIILDIVEKYDYEAPENASLLNEIIGGGPGGKMITKGELRNKHFYLHHLQMVNGVSAAKAIAIKEKYPTLRELFKAWENGPKPEALLQDIKVGNRLLGPKLSKNIYETVWSQ